MLIIRLREIAIKGGYYCQSQPKRRRNGLPKKIRSADSGNAPDRVCSRSGTQRFLATLARVARHHRGISRRRLLGRNKESELEAKTVPSSQGLP